MDKRVLLSEIDLLLKKISARHQKMTAYGSDVPDGLAELMQQEVLLLYRKYVQLELLQSEDAPRVTVKAEPVEAPKTTAAPVTETPAVKTPEPGTPKPEVEVPKAEVPQPEPQKAPEQPKPVQEKQEDADSLIHMVQQALTGQGERRENPFATPQPSVKPQVQEIPVAKKPEATPEPAQKPVSQPQPVTPKPSAQPEEAPLTLADRLRMQGIADLRKAIPLSDKFLYMNELFEGEIDHYNQAIERFNACANAQDARDLFESMKQHFEWDENSKTVKRFADLLTRKFL